MNKAYNKITWQNKPSTATPLNQTNLNEMSNALDTIDDRVIALDSGKVSSVTVTNTLPTGDTIATITVDGTATNIKSAQVVVDDTPSATSENPLQNKAIYEMLNNLLPEETAEGNPISITDASGLNAKTCSVDLLPIQDLSHGEPSPTNICPISGRNSVKVKRMGVNQWDEQWESGSYRSADGTPSVDNSRIRSKNRVEVLSDSMYLVTLASTIIFMYDATDTYLGYKSVNGSGIITPITWYANAKYIRFSVGSSTNPITTYTSGIAINYPSTETDYEPYQGETYTETLGQTVYGGKVDFVSGEGQIDYRSIDENSFSSVNTSSSSGGLHWTDVVIGYTPTNIVCDRLARKDGNSGWSSTTPCISYVESGGSKLLRIYCSEGSISDFKTAYAGLQIVFSRETPATLTLTAEQISLLKGNNVISTDGDNIKLVYSADIKAWVENQLQS